MIHLSIRRSTIRCSKTRSTNFHQSKTNHRSNRHSKTNYRLTILPKYSHCPKSIRHSKSLHPKTRSHQTNSR